MAQTSLAQGDELFSHKCQVLNSKLARLVQILDREGNVTITKEKAEEFDDDIDIDVGVEDYVDVDDDLEKSRKEKQEKDILNLREKEVIFF